MFKPPPSHVKRIWVGQSEIIMPRHKVAQGRYIKCLFYLSFCPIWYVSLRPYANNIGPLVKTDAY